jgi:hypothetical protein
LKAAISGFARKKRGRAFFFRSVFLIEPKTKVKNKGQNLKCKGKTALLKGKSPPSKGLG